MDNNKFNTIVDALKNNNHFKKLLVFTGYKDNEYLLTELAIMSLDDELMNIALNTVNEKSLMQVLNSYNGLSTKQKNATKVLFEYIRLSNYTIFSHNNFNSHFSIIFNLISDNSSITYEEISMLIKLNFPNKPVYTISENEWEASKNIGDARIK